MMPTRNVVLTAHHEEFIEGLVKKGRYQNASEVLRDGLRLVEGRERAEAAKLEALKAAAQLGAAAIERGEFKEFDDAATVRVHLKGIADRVLRGPGTE
jgi:antitoxin ParD1/3/4